MSVRLILFAMGLVALGACSIENAKPAATRADSVATAKADSSAAVSPAVNPAADSAVPVVQIAYSPDVDSAKIQSWADYDAAKTRAWVRKDSASTHAWMRKDSASTANWMVYSNFEHDQMMALRADARPAYLEWLDAEKLYDFRRVDSLKKNSPEMREYARVTDSANKVRYIADTTAQRTYQDATKKINAVYVEELAIIERAWRAAESRQKAKGGFGF